VLLPKDSHGDPYFFLNTNRFWLGVGLIVCIAAALIDYHFWQRTWWIWLGVGAITLVFLFSFRTSECGSTAPAAGSDSARLVFNRGDCETLPRYFFLAWWFARYEKFRKTIRLFGFAIPLAIVSALLALIIFEVDLGTTALIGRDHVYGHVRCRNESDFARPARRHRRKRHFRGGNAGAHGTPDRVQPISSATNRMPDSSKCRR